MLWGGLRRMDYGGRRTAGETALQGREAEIQAGECQAERAEDPLAPAD